MKKIFTTLLSAVMTLTAFAAGEINIAGVSLTKEVIEAGITDSLANNANVTEVSGIITYDTLNYVLTFENVYLKTTVTEIITFNPNSNGITFTLHLVGENTIETTVYQNGVGIQMPNYQNPIIVIDGNKTGILNIKGNYLMAYALQTNGGNKIALKDANVNALAGSVGANGFTGELVVENSNLTIYSEQGHALGGLQALTFIDSYLAGPEGSYITDFWGENEGCYGVERPDDKYDQPIVIKRKPVVGDTIRYEYKDNNLYYKIIKQTDAANWVEVVNDGTSANSWTPANEPTGMVVIPNRVVDGMGIEYDVKSVAGDYSYQAFRGCSQITGIDFSENTFIQSTGWGAFRYCPNLQTVILNDVIDRIPDYCFGGCPITSIDLKNVAFVGMVNFDDAHIDSLHIPAALSYFDPQSYLFLHTKKVTCDEDNTSYCVENNMLLSKDKKTLVAIPCGQTEGELRIPSSVENATARAMTGCEATICFPRAIVFNESPDSRNSPEGDVIVNCGLLEYYTTGAFAGGNHHFFKVDTVIERLVWDVQAESTTLGTVNITDTTDCNTVTVELSGYPSSYTFMGWSNGSTELTTTYDITSDTLIVAYVKAPLNPGGCFSAMTVEGVDLAYKILTKQPGNMTVQVGDGDNPAMGQGNGGELTIPAKVMYYDEEYDVVKVGSGAFRNCSMLEKVNLPNSVKQIGSSAFKYCSSLEEVTFPEGLEETGQMAFAYSHLKRADLPNSLTTLGSYTFYECRHLTSVTLSENLDYIQEWTFGYCVVLNELTLPSSVKWIGYAAFDYSSLETLNWDADAIERVGLGAFNNTPFLENLQAENNLKYKDKVLLSYDDSSITEADIKEGTEVIGAEALGWSLDDLTKVTLPSTTKAIGENAFYHNAVLETCSIKAVTPPLVYALQDVKDTDVDANTLFRMWNGSQYVNKENMVIFVPKAGIGDYKTNDQWKMMDLRPIGGWTIRFVDHAGIDLIDPQQVEQGQRPTTIPTEVETYYTYDNMFVFANAWDTTVVGVGDTTYVARYTAQDLPVYKVYFHETQEDAEAMTTSVSFAKVQHGHAVSDEVLAAQVASIEVRECEEIHEWAGGDITNVTAVLHVYPVWGDGFYDITFFDPVADQIIAVRENVECGEIVVAPEGPEHQGKRFEGWDDLTWQTTRRYTGDLVVNAIYEDEGQAIENVFGTEKATKVIRNGVLYIERNGKLYNAQGGLVE